LIRAGGGSPKTPRTRATPPDEELTTEIGSCVLISAEEPTVARKLTVSEGMATEIANELTVQVINCS